MSSTPVPHPQSNNQGLDLAAAEAALSSAVITRVSGSRPLTQRRWFKKAAFYAGAALTGWTVSALIGAGMNKSGLTDEFSSFRNPVASFESAPQSIKWVELPSSAFLEAGRRPDGTLSIQKMFEAWERAGLPDSDVMGVWNKVNLLRPTLLGRSDPVLEAQLVAEANTAALGLEVKYPEVLERLKLNQAAPEPGGWSDLIPEMASRISDMVPEHDWSLDDRMKNCSSGMRPIAGYPSPWRFRPCSSLA